MMTNEVKEKVLRLKQEGWPNSKIAEEVGCKKNTVDGWIRKAGLSTFVRSKGLPKEVKDKILELRGQGKSYEIIGLELGLTRAVLMNAAYKLKLPKKRSPEEVRALYAEMIEMRECGFSNRDIADKLGLAYDSVRVYLYKAGYRAQAYRWANIKMRIDTWNKLKAAAEIRGMKPDVLIHRLVEVTIRDNILDSVLDDLEELENET